MKKAAQMVTLAVKMVALKCARSSVSWKAHQSFSELLWALVGTEISKLAASRTAKEKFFLKFRHFHFTEGRSEGRRIGWLFLSCLGALRCTVAHRSLMLRRTWHRNSAFWFVNGAEPRILARSLHTIFVLL